MTSKEAAQALEAIREAAHAQYSDNGARLTQLDHALDTAAMAYECLVDEDAREKDLRTRVRKDRESFDRYGHLIRGGADSLFEEGK